MKKSLSLLSVLLLSSSVVYAESQVGTSHVRIAPTLDIEEIQAANFGNIFIL